MNYGQSQESKIIEGVMELALADKFSTVDKVYENIENSRQKSENYNVPFYLKALYGIDTYKYKNSIGSDDKTAEMTVGVFNKGATSGRYILYFPGGAYIDPPMLFHYMFLSRLAAKMNATVIMPVYLKGPDYDYAESYALSMNFYKELLYNGWEGVDGKKIDAANLIVMGDSAGASYSIAVSYLAKEYGYAVPAHCVMFSPCPDMISDNPEIAEYEEKDPMIVISGVKLKLLAFVYGTAEKLEDIDVTDPSVREFLHNPILSPLYIKNFEGLPELTIFVGTKEVLNPDCRKFAETIESTGSSVNFYEFKNMLHTFPIFPIPESDEAINIVKNIVG